MAAVQPGPAVEPAVVRLAWAQREAEVADEVAAKMAAKRVKFTARAAEMVAAVEESYADALGMQEEAHAKVAALAEEAGITPNHETTRG